MKISVVLVEPNQRPKMVEIENTLEAMQQVVGGYIQAVYPFEEPVALICNEEGKLNGMPLNRAIYDEPQKQEVTYTELTRRFREIEGSGKAVHLTGYIVFSEDSFSRPYSEASRTYVVSSDNKAFQPHMGGYSIYGSALDGSDSNVRLEQYMAAEHGGKDGWKVEKCYLEIPSKEILDIIAGPFFLAYADAEDLQSLPKPLAQKYLERFKCPEIFFKRDGKIMAIPSLS